MINTISRTEAIRLALTTKQPVIRFAADGLDIQTEHMRIQGTASAAGYKISTKRVRVVADDDFPVQAIIITAKEA